jgi:hypothetical protein
MTLVLDTGALIAIERNDRAMWRRLKSALLASRIPITHAGVVGQVWRGGGARSVPLALALAGIEVRALDEDLGKRSGELLGRARRNDVIDAALVLLSTDGDVIVTSDPGDLEPLARTAGRLVDVLQV